LKSEQGQATLRVEGDLQPALGDFSEAAALRIGGPTNADNPMSSSVAGTVVRAFKGNGIIWDQGAMIDFSNVFIEDVTVDGIRGTAICEDNNHGFLANTHVIRAVRYGYAFLNVPGEIEHPNNSRVHQFVDAKAFQCGRNFYIESETNCGTVFSE